MEVDYNGGGVRLKLMEGPPVTGHRPSVDVLFRSVAGQVGPKALGVILTGMGRDGADGLLKMRQQGAHTLGESVKTCVVYGMPRAAKELGGVVEELALTKIPHRLVELIGKTGAIRAAQP
jgi:two-component system chemotaxis response regulator CheB